MGFAEKRKLLPEEAAMLAKIASQPRDKFDDQSWDFIDKSHNRKYAYTWGLSEKQLAWVRKLHGQMFPADAVQHQPAASDNGLKGEFCRADNTPGGYQIVLHDMVIGPFVTKGEAATIVTWLDKAIVNLEQLYGPPNMPEGPSETKEAAPEGAASGEEYQPSPGDPF